MSTDLAVIEAALKATRDGRAVMHSMPIQHSMPGYWWKAAADVRDFEMNAYDMVAELVERVKVAEAAIERVRAAAADHPGSAWDSGIKLRADILRALDGDAKRCTSDITLRDEEHRLCRCTLTEGHAGVHDDGAGTTWTGGDA